MRQLTTFLVQKNLIHFGLKDIGFLYKKQTRILNLREQAEKRTLVPEEEQRSKQLKALVKEMNENLKQDRFQNACKNFIRIQAYKLTSWNEISYLWTYAVKNKNPGMINVILDLITKGRVSNTIQQDSITSNSIDLMTRTQGILINQYGNSRMRTENPYELFDHYSVYHEALGKQTPALDESKLSKLPTEQGDLPEFTPLDHEEFKTLLNETGPNTVQAKFFMKNSHLNSPYLPASYPFNSPPHFPHPLQSLDAQLFSPELMLPQRIR